MTEVKNLVIKTKKIGELTALDLKIRLKRHRKYIDLHFVPTDAYRIYQALLKAIE